MIVCYNRKKETHIKNNFPIYRPYILSNPYTDIVNKKTKAIYKVGSREEAIKCYSHYFDLMYGSNKEFTKAVDEIYELYKNGEDVYLECYCKPLPCHGDVIIEKLQNRLLKEKLDKIRNINKNESTL